MAKPYLCRFGVAQISVNPAYADELVSSLQEPTFPEDIERVGLFTIAGIEEINALRQTISDRYVAHLNRKIETIIRFGCEQRLQLLVFPEYSIPAESLRVCKSLSDELDLTIIAGTHIVTLSPSAQAAYRDLSLVLPDRPAGLENAVRQAVCSVFRPAKPPLVFVKYVRSKQETALIPGTPSVHSFEMMTSSGKLEVQVLTCIEALTKFSVLKEKHTHPRSVAIPAFRTKATDLDNIAQQALGQGKCTLLANVAEFGGSKVFVRAERATFWFSESDGSKPIPQHSEALVIVEADLERQFEIRKLARESSAVSALRVYPLLYPSSSQEARSYASGFESWCTTPKTPEQLAEFARPFEDLNRKVFPPLLQEKLTHFTAHLVPAGIISVEDGRDWLKPIVVGDTPSTNALRWELCNRALETVNQLHLSGKHLSRTKDLTDVYAHLLEKRNQLMEFILSTEAPQQSPSPQALTALPRRSESPFRNRANEFDLIAEFVTQAQEVAFILSGMRGIGKTTMVQEASRHAIPPRRKIWLPLTEGISQSRLLAQLAYECNLQIPDDLDLSAPEKQVEIEQRILSYLSQSPNTLIVIDEFQFLLSGAGDVEDAGVRHLLRNLLQGAEKTRSKYVFISDVVPRLGPDLEALCRRYSLQGLAGRDTERLLLYWFQSQNDAFTGQPPAAPERLISILGGHPLATKIAAGLWAEHPSADISREVSIFKELRETIVPFILERLSLSAAQSDLMRFASVFRLPVSRDAFVAWRGQDANYLLNALTSQYLIESSEKGYQLHPLVRAFYYDALPLNTLIEFHRIAAKFYHQLFERTKKTTKQLVPEYLGEAVHHSLAAGDRRKVQELAFYRQELRPVALSHYRKANYGLALKEYKVLADIDDRDLDAHFHLALIHARHNRWPDAELHFGKANEIRPNSPWVLQGFGAAKLRAGRLAEAEALLTRAEEINPNHAATLVDLGRLRERQGDLAAAETYFGRAIEVDHENSFAHYLMARLLYRQDEISDAYQYALTALATNPTDSRNKDLLKELKEKLGANGET
jgi:tetratricopeptide (TPR) repeat protein